MQNPVTPSSNLARLAGAAALFVVAVSGWLLLALENRSHGTAGLMLFVLLASLFIVMELRSARPLRGTYAQASPGGYQEPGEAALASLIDPETTLPRVWLFLARLREEVQRAERYGRRLTLCVLEPEDRLVCLDGEFRGKVGRAVQAHLRGSDFATIGHSGRLLVLLPEIVGPAAQKAAERLMAMLNSLMAEGKTLPWRAAVVCYPRHGKDAQQLLDSAERVLAQRPAA